MVTKHTKPSAESPEGGIKKVEASIHMSNLMLVDPATGEANQSWEKARRKRQIAKIFKENRGGNQKWLIQDLKEIYEKDDSSCS